MHPMLASPTEGASALLMPSDGSDGMAHLSGFPQERSNVRGEQQQTAEPQQTLQQTLQQTGTLCNPTLQGGVSTDAGASNIYRHCKISDFFTLGATLGKGSFAVVKEVRWRMRPLIFSHFAPCSCSCVGSVHQAAHLRFLFVYMTLLCHSP